LIGVTGGLAAPLVAAGIGTVMGGLGLGATAAAGLLGTLAESSIVVGALFGESSFFHVFRPLRTISSQASILISQIQEPTAAA
jgi:hypothetical protein